MNHCRRYWKSRQRGYNVFFSLSSEICAKWFYSGGICSQWFKKVYLRLWRWLYTI